MNNNKHEVADILAQVPLFSKLSKRELKKLAGLCIRKNFAAGVTVVEEGKTGLGLFVITEGQIAVYKGAGENRVKLAELGDGDIIGEMSLIDDRPRSATGIALRDSECLLITRDSFLTLVEKNTEIAWCLVPVLAERLRAVETELMREYKDDQNARGEAVSAPPATAELETQTEDEEPSEKEQARLLNLMQAEYAMLMAGMRGLKVGVSAGETFLRTLADETSLHKEKRWSKLVGRLPDALRSAFADAISEGEKLPEKMLSTYKHTRRKRQA